MSRAPVPARTTWPSTTAIAVIGRSAPLTVEATSDGWVVLTPVGNMGQSFYAVPTSRLQLAPTEAREWTSAYHAALSLPRDTAKGRPQIRIPRLGRGLVFIGESDQVPGVPSAKSFAFQRCDAVGSPLYLSIDEMQQLLRAMDRAATTAERSAARPVPPTLGRPYYASELSCSALPMVGNPVPRFPSDMASSSRQYTDVGIRFVVDTAGYVEAGSVTTLPGTPSALERASRELVARWRFRPAVRGGLPVRQVIATTITYDPARPDEPERPPRTTSQPQILDYGRDEPFASVDYNGLRTVVSTDDGWVRVRVGMWNTSGAFSGAQEWFSPDSVDAWAERSLVYFDSARKRPPKSLAGDQVEALSHPMGGTYEVRFTARAAGKDTVWTSAARMRSCIGGSAHADFGDRAGIERFIAAANAARAERATPREPGDSVYQRGDVGCRAFIPDAVVLQDAPSVKRQPRAPIAPSMDARNARAEVLTSFVVGKDGVPKPSTLVAMPGSDPLAVEALRASLDRYRFQPASRSGVPVNALVVRNWSFEPHPRCRETYEGIDCPKVYSRGP